MMMDRLKEMNKKDDDNYTLGQVILFGICALGCAVSLYGMAVIGALFINN